MIILVIQVVNYLLRGWIKNLESEGSVALPLLDDPESMLVGIAKDLEFIREGTKRSVRVRFFGSEVSLLKRMGSFFQSQLGNLRTKFQ